MQHEIHRPNHWLVFPNNWALVVANAVLCEHKVPIRAYGTTSINLSWLSHELRNQVEVFWNLQNTTPFCSQFEKDFMKYESHTSNMTFKLNSNFFKLNFIFFKLNSNDFKWNSIFFKLICKYFKWNYKFFKLNCNFFKLNEKWCRWLRQI